MKMKRLSFLLITLMIAAVLPLSGCGSIKTTQDNASINLRFSFWEPSTGREMENALQKIVDSYETDHPDVHIELVPNAVSGYQDWIKTQLSVDDLPEIEMNYAPTLIAQYNSGAIENIADALNGKNPYNNNNIWKESFAGDTLDAAHEYRVEPEFNIPLFRTGIAMYYNKDIYKELGLEVPGTWDEFLANCQKIEDAKKIPNAFMAQKKDAVRWLEYEVMGGCCIEKWLADEKLNYNGDSNFGKYEVIRAIDSGDYSIAENKEYQKDFETYLDHIREYVKYTPNASGLDEASAKTLFLSGQAAHLNTGSWDIVGLLNNDEVEFEVGVFPFPRMTKDNSEYAGKGISNNAVQTLAITKSVAKQEGAKEAAVDFLMYLTAPEQYSSFVNETFLIPAINDVKADPVFDAFIEDGYPICILYTVGDSAAGQSFEDVVNNIIAGKRVELNDSTYKTIDKSLQMFCQTFMEANDLNKDNNYKLDNSPVIGEMFR